MKKNKKPEKIVQEILEACERYEKHFGIGYPLTSGTFELQLIEDCIKANKPLHKLYPDLNYFKPDGECSEVEKLYINSLDLDDAASFVGGYVKPMTKKEQEEMSQWMSQYDWRAISKFCRENNITDGLTDEELEQFRRK